METTKRSRERPLGPKTARHARESGSREAHARPLPCVLVIAGVDPGGGAGVAADVRAARVAGAFACPVVATITVQSTSGFMRQESVAASLVRAQAECVLAHQAVRAIKTGALGSAENVRAVALLARAHRALPLVVDPVRIPTRGKRALMEAAAFDVVRRELVPLATVVTANADEASALVGNEVKSVQHARDAARAIVLLGARAALVKGGHLRSRDRAVDVLAIGERVYELDSERLRIGVVHGGGCTLASLVAARLANTRAPLDDSAVVAALRWSKRAHRRALVSARADVGGRSLVLAI